MSWGGGWGDGGEEWGGGRGGSGVVWVCFFYKRVGV